MSEIPHPFIVESIERFKALPEEDRDSVHFLHLNHSNPAADPDSDAAAAVRAAGHHICAEGQRFDL
jgi:pyrroloquinoline quinone biosynthesis protein B